MNNEQTTTQTTPPAAEYLNISFCIIARKADAGWMPQLLQSLPKGGEVCILWNQQGEYEEFTTEEPKQLPDGTVMRYASWTYEGMFDFAAARNLCIGSASRGWIMWLDADDRLLPHQHSVLRSLDETYPAGVGGLTCALVGVNPPTPGNEKGQVYGIPHLRIFRNHHNFQFRGRCHEQILPSILEQGFQYLPSPVVVHHVGYEVDESVMVEKMLRNTRLLAQMFAHDEYPDRGFVARMLHRDLQNYLALTHTPIKE